MKKLLLLTLTIFALWIPPVWSQSAQDLSGTVDLSPQSPTASWPASGQGNQLSPNYTATIIVTVADQGTVKGVKYTLSTGPTTTPTSSDTNVIWTGAASSTTFTVTNTAADSATAGLKISCVWKPASGGGSGGSGSGAAEITGQGDASLVLLDSAASWTIARKTQWVDKELNWQVDFRDTNGMAITRNTLDTLEVKDGKPAGVTWEITPQAGSGSSSVMEGTAKTATPSQGRIKMKYNDGSQEETTSDTLCFMKAEIVSVGFSGDHKFTEWSTKTPIDPSDSVPIWKKTNSPNDNKPVIYTKSTKPTAFAKFKLEPKDAPNTTVVLKVKKSGAEVAKKSGVSMNTGPSQEFEVDPIAFSQELSNSIRITKPDLTWSLALDESEAFAAAGSSTIVFYWTRATPTTGVLYDIGPQKACEYIDSTPGDAKYCNEGVARDIAYVPGLDFIPDPAGIYDVGAAKCDEHARLLQFLLKSIGADGGFYTYYWGGTATERKLYAPINGELATFRCGRDAEDGVPANPYFHYHVMSNIEGTIYDPSYGKIGAPELTKLVPADEDNAPFGNFPGDEDKDWNKNGTKDPAATVQTGTSLPPGSTRNATPP